MQLDVGTLAGMITSVLASARRLRHLPGSSCELVSVLLCARLS